MSQGVQSIITAIGELSSREKLELLAVISRDLQQTQVIEEESAAFRKAPSLDELIKKQGVPVVGDVRLCMGDFWPEDESADDVNRYVAEQRRLDRLGTL